MKKFAAQFIFSFLFLTHPFNSFAQQPQGYGPWNRDLNFFESANGYTFTQKEMTVERAGVPNLARGSDGTLYLAFQWFSLEWRQAFDQIAVIKSEDDGKNWTEPEPISIEQFPKNLYRAFDPTLTALPEGGFRLYFTSERVTQQKPRGNRAIFSARSKDGINFTFEPGQRFGFEENETYDPAVVNFQGVWHLYCPVSGQEGAGYHAVSNDGLNFTQLENVHVSEPNIWIGNAMVYKGEVWFYGSGRHVWRAHSSDGANWTVDLGLRLDGGDPAVIVKQDGNLLGVTTGELRSDAFREYPFQN